VLSGRGLCDELITRPEGFYRLCCVVVCDLETSRMGAPYIYDISTLRVKVTHFSKVNRVTSVIYVCVCKICDISISIAVTTNTEIAEYRTVVMYPFMVRVLSVEKTFVV